MTPEDLKSLRDFITAPDYDPEYDDLSTDVHRLIEEVERLRKGLESLKGEEVRQVGGWTTPRTTSYFVLNRAVDQILEGE